MLQTFKNGQGSIVLRVKVLDSTSTTGAGLTGLTSASSGLRISTIADNEAAATAYTVAGSTIESITTLGTFAAPTATKVRFKEVDSTNHPGVYELQIADARYAVSSAKSLLVSMSGATNMAQTDFVVQLQSDDPYIAKPTGFATNVAQTGDSFARLGAPAGASIAVDVAGVQSDTNDIQARIPAALVSGRMDSSTGAMAANVLTAAAINADAFTAAKFAADVTTELQSGLATATAVSTLTSYVDTEVAACLAVLNKLDTMMQAASGSPGDYEYRADALRRAPTGSGGGGGSIGVSDIWAEALPGAYSAGSAGYLVGTYLDALISNIPTAIENADALLDRDMSTGVDSGSPTVRTVRQALRALRNRWANSAGTYSVYKENDITVSWTSVIATSAGAEPIVSSDPA